MNCLSFCVQFCTDTLFAVVDMPKIEAGRVYFRRGVVTGLIIIRYAVGECENVYNRALEPG